MPPTEEECDRVRRGWALAASLGAQMARAFYTNLFRLDPSAQPLFRGEMALQERKLTETLGFIVDHLDTPEALLPEARRLAIRHVAYGVTPAQYASVGAALIAALKDLLGPDLGAEDEAAWANVYGFLSREMVAAAYADA